MKLSKAYSMYGASMGRHNTITETESPIKFKLYQVRLDSGGYDNGGAYWGIGQPLYHAYGEGVRDDQELFLRADNRNDAKKYIRGIYPNARFFH